MVYGSDSSFMPFGNRRIEILYKRPQKQEGEDELCSICSKPLSEGRHTDCKLEQMVRDLEAIADDKHPKNK